MFDIKTSNNIDEVTSNIGRQEQKIKLAVIKVLNKTALWLKSQAAKEISEEKKIKLTIMRKRLRIFKASRLNVLIRANLYDIRAASIGKIKQTRKGAKAGKHQFMGAFMATMPRGYRGVFKREGKTSLPIEEIKLPLKPEGSRIMKDLVNYEVEKVFEKFLQRELDYILKI